MDLHSYVPQILIEDKDYKVFLDIINQVSTDVHDLIKLVPELVDVDNVSDIFLPKLAALVRYNFRSDLDHDYQREIIKRLIEIYKSRGSDDEIIMAATYGDYEYWVGSHIFYPGAVLDRQKAEVLNPMDEVFRHSKSKFSELARYPGPSLYHDGVIVIKVTNINDDIRNAIKRVVPAGIKIYYYLTTDTSDEYGFIVDFGEWVIETEDILYIELRDNLMTPKPARRSHPHGARSSVYVFSGIKGYATSFLADTPIEPSHEGYNAELVDDKYIRDSLDFENPDFEVIVVKDN